MSGPDAEPTPPPTSPGAATPGAAGDLRAALREQLPDGSDVVVDPVGGALAEPALRSLRYGGRFVSVGYASGEIPRIPLNLVMLKGIQVLGFQFLTFATNEPDAGNEARAPYVAAYLKRSSETTKLPQPANVSNTNLGYDAVHILAQIMSEKGIDGTTDPAKAREAIKDGLAALKEYRGVSLIRPSSPSSPHAGSSRKTRPATR